MISTKVTLILLLRYMRFSVIHWYATTHNPFHQPSLQQVYVEAGIA